jgi:hypothetical protein
MLTSRYRLSEGKKLSKSVELGHADSLKIVLTTQEGKSAKRPHQAFLSLHDPATGLETSFPFSVKESGKAKVDLVCFSSKTVDARSHGHRLKRTFQHNSLSLRSPSQRLS